MKINRQPQAGTEKIQDSFYRKNILTERAERIMNTLKEEIHARAKAQEQKNKEAEKPKAHKKGDVEL